MSESAPRKRATPGPEETVTDDLPRYRIELERIDGRSRRVDHVRARSIEDALIRVRHADDGPSDGAGDDPNSFRVVEVTEQSASSEAGISATRAGAT